MKKELSSRAFQSLRKTADFYPAANQLRGFFEETFKDPFRANGNRFCWDYWSVPDQYRLLRTPAENFFPQELYIPFLEKLTEYGRNALGCQMISRPWLSAYIDGSYQNLHSDVPHGPFSFVYSLTPWKKRAFQGGETLIAKPTLLRYFSEIDPGVSHEKRHLLQKVPAEFNQLTVFDPRYPHGVERVSGVESILDSRLVIHGWFTEPNPMIFGPLTFKKVQKPLDQIAGEILNRLTALPYSGYLGLKLTILPSGRTSNFEALSAHLIDGMGEVISKKMLSEVLTVPEVMFPKAASPSIVTLPLQIYG